MEDYRDPAQCFLNGQSPNSFGVSGAMGWDDSEFPLGLDSNDPEIPDPSGSIDGRNIPIPRSIGF